MDLKLSEKCLNSFIKVIHDLTGITIANNRVSMVEGRLRKRVVALKLVNYESYLELVREDRKEQSVFIDLVTTNETYFFRTPRIWEFIENKFLPNWHAKNSRQVFTAWSAAASSGEEAHSLAIVCQAFKEKHPNFLYQLYGTDISNEMVDLCNRGTYSGRSIDSFRKTRPVLFQKYMKNIAEDSFQVVPEIKSRIKFQQHNLFKSLPQREPFSLVLLRNVLIYFTGSDQEKVISLIAPKLSPEGVMIIGESESLSHIKTSFKSVEPLVYHIDKSSNGDLKAG